MGNEVRGIMKFADVRVVFILFPLLAAATALAGVQTCRGATGSAPAAGTASEPAGLRVKALSQEGRTLLSHGEYEAALKPLMQAYQLDPQNMDSIHFIMAAYFRSGRYGEAIAFLAQAGNKLEQAVDRKEINEVIALLFFKKGLKDAKDGKEEAAEISLRNAVALDPQSVQYLEALARMRHKAGHFDEAERLLSQGLEQVTDEPSRRGLMAAQEKLRLTEMIIKKLQ